MNLQIDQTQSFNQSMDIICREVERMYVELDDFRLGENPHYILCAGNPNANIAVAQLQTNSAEIYWGERDNTHFNHCCIGPDGHTFRDAAARYGFKEYDFFFFNIVPYVSKGEGEYPLEVAEKFKPVAEAVLSVIKPKVLVTLGYRAFQILGKDMLLDDWEEHLEAGSFFKKKGKDLTIVPLWDPRDVSINMPLRYKSFFSGIKKMYSITRRYK